MRPLIGISPCLDDRGRWRSGRDYHYIDRAYARAVEACGGDPVYAATQRDTRAFLEHVDGLLLPGGGDFLPPRAYAENVRFDAVPEEQLDHDARLLAGALERHLPVLGICYGMQLLAVHHGGALHYDLPTDVPEAAEHRLPEPDGRHAIAIEASSILRDILGTSPEPVNSLHHQGVAEPGERLRVSARTSDGVIEAIEGDAPFCIGVQWHPEKMEGAHRDRLFSAFVAACSEARRS